MDLALRILKAKIEMAGLGLFVRESRSRKDALFLTEDEQEAHGIGWITVEGRINFIRTGKTVNSFDSPGALLAFLRRMQP